jgi:para-aminobenzoate synthetase component 1
MPRPVLSPLDAAARLAGRRGRAVLSSAPAGAEPGQCSFVAAEPQATLIARGHSLVVLDAAGRPQRRFTGNPLDAAEAFLAEHDCRLEPRAGGDPEPRVIGYLGYDLARVIERLPGGAALAHNGPDLWLAVYGAVARWSAGELAITGTDRAARDRLGEAFAQPAPPVIAPSFGPLIAADDDAHHIARIERARDHLAAGELAQLTLARRLVARIASPGDALALHAALAEAAPAPYGALLELDGVTLISASPERFLASVGDRVETRPATRRRDGASDPADAAAHQRTVDIAREALLRVADPASIAIDQLADLAELPGLVHRVSRVAARPRPGTGYAALLRAVFPAGSVTGAPRLRAMQLIDELEPVRRGPFCGALGYFGARGAFDLALASRIGVLAQRELRIQVGGRIVAETDAAAELAETAREAAGWTAALGQLGRQRAG